MTALSPSSLAAAVLRLTAALENETSLARVGALEDLAAAAAEKQAAFDALCVLHDGSQSCEIDKMVDQGIMRALMSAAKENAVVLEAVKSTLDAAAHRLRSLVGSVVDPGTYGRFGQPARHIPAARINACA